MVHTTVRPVFTVLRTARITMAAARASSPAGADMMTEAMTHVTCLSLSLLLQASGNAAAVSVPV